MAEDDNTDYTSISDPEIVGGSLAGVVLVALIMGVTIWCWRKGKCSYCQRSTTVIEENEMYGAPADYDEYDKDAYDTKIVENNDYYYESWLIWNVCLWYE